MDSTSENEVYEDEFCDFCKEGESAFECVSCNKWACWECHIVVPCVEEPDNPYWICTDCLNDKGTSKTYMVYKFKGKTYMKEIKTPVKSAHKQ